MEENQVPSPDPGPGRYHDGELSPEERARMEERLKSSAPLREELEWLKRLGKGMRTGAPGAPPEGLGRRIMSKIREIQASDHPLITLMPLMTRLAVAAAILVLIAVGALFLQMRAGGVKHSQPGVEWVQVKRPDLLAPAGATMLRFHEPRPSELYQ